MEVDSGIGDDLCERRAGESRRVFGPDTATGLFINRKARMRLAKAKNAYSPNVSRVGGVPQKSLSELHPPEANPAFERCPMRARPRSEPLLLAGLAGIGLKKLKSRGEKA